MLVTFTILIDAYLWLGIDPLLAVTLEDTRRNMSQGAADRAGAGRGEW